MSSNKWLKVPLMIVVIVGLYVVYTVWISPALDNRRILNLVEQGEQIGREALCVQSLDINQNCDDFWFSANACKDKINYYISFITTWGKDAANSPYWVGYHPASEYYAELTKFDQLMTTKTKLCKLYYQQKDVLQKQLQAQIKAEDESVREAQLQASLEAQRQREEQRQGEAQAQLNQALKDYAESEKFQPSSGRKYTTVGDMMTKSSHIDTYRIRCASCTRSGEPLEFDTSNTCQESCLNYCHRQGYAAMQPENSFLESPQICQCGCVGGGN